MPLEDKGRRQKSGIDTIKVSKGAKIRNRYTSTTPDPGHHLDERIKLNKECIWISTAVVMLLLKYIKIRFTEVSGSVIILFADTLMQFILSILVCFREAGY